MSDKINLDEKFALFADQWRPKTVASLNQQDVKLVKVQGEFPWHKHEAEDEFFLVWKGNFRVEFRDRTVDLGPGEALVVKRGVEHLTTADKEAQIIIFEPAGVRNTGDVMDPTYTAPEGVRI
ncbi:MAG: cupin domain-containing protein [Bradyrhizobium sp.]